jgi:hypothetical protein
VVGSELIDIRVVFVVANDGIEEAELVQPWPNIADAGARNGAHGPKTLGALCRGLATALAQTCVTT